MKLFLAFALTSLTYAADPTGSLTGKVLDPSGAVVAGAKLTAISQGTGLKREAISASDGGFLIPLLPPGAYNLTAAASGFQSYEQQGLIVAVNATVSTTVTLKIGAVTDSVRVEADAGQVETRSGALGQTIEQRKITDLPLNGRNAATLILLTPGTADLNAR